MGFEKHVFKVNGEKQTFHTCNDFWECDCKTSFYHPYTEHRCDKCGMDSNDCPHARVEEMLVKLNSFPIPTVDLVKLRAREAAQRKLEEYVFTAFECLSSATQQIKTMRQAMHDMNLDQDAHNLLVDIEMSVDKAKYNLSQHGW